MGSLTCLALAALAALLAATSSAGAACREIDDSSARYALCEFDARRDEIRLFLRGADGETLGSFSQLEAELARKGETLVFAMNAGMYSEDFSPVGLYVEAGETKHAANLRSGAGNFHMKPNGVFWVADGRAGVAETNAFLKKRLRPAYATQSGPLLVVGGRINPHIHEDGQSAKIRNGVCVTDGRIAHFAISNEPVTFHAFAHLFRERLGCSDALYLDGSISSLYAPQLDRHDRFRPLGPIVGVVKGLRR
ncbi:MAG TPA: phosphodiester glycosidase family protein [Methylocystis sp.]|nr:phosphodiester glycosidase family protein [Methylocystis sp.]